jgi:hypothetical protein
LGLTIDVFSPENPMNEAPKTSSECDLEASNYSLYNLASKKRYLVGGFNHLEKY